MKWATRAGCHVDRAACARLIGRFVDVEAQFVFVDDPDDGPSDATPFDMRGVELSHYQGDCTFETALHRFELDDPVLWDIARIGDDAVLAVTKPIFDGLYEYRRQALLLGREPA